MLETQYCIHEAKSPQAVHSPARPTRAHIAPDPCRAFPACRPAIPLLGSRIVPAVPLSNASTSIFLISFGASRPTGFLFQNFTAGICALAAGAYIQRDRTPALVQQLDFRSGIAVILCSFCPCFSPAPKRTFSARLQSAFVTLYGSFTALRFFSLS